MDGDRSTFKKTVDYSLLLSLSEAYSTQQLHKQIGQQLAGPDSGTLEGDDE